VTERDEQLGPPRRDNTAEGMGKRKKVFEVKGSQRAIKKYGAKSTGTFHQKRVKMGLKARGGALFRNDLNRGVFNNFKAEGEGRWGRRTRPR